jgi:serine/threonine protein kinase
MNHGDATDRADSTPSKGSTSIRRTASSGSTAPLSSSTDPGDFELDQTVVSAAPPLAVQPIGRGLKPRELGQALLGQKLDHVLLEEYVGGGGMGAVFRGWDTDLHRTVAVKVLSTYQAGDEESQRRFQTEARSAARLDHPNIARVHYVGEDRGIRYIVFEFIEGTNIRDLVYANGPLPLTDALNFTLQIANALVHAGEREIVHRDIKPSNILITPDGLAKLVDMGLARSDHFDQTEREHTATGVTLGTFDYISPEQARNPRDADTRSDIYSLGCTLFYMLAAQPPFPDGTPVQKLLQHQSDTPPDVRQFRGDVSDMLVGVLGTMLAKRPEDRFQTPTELVAALVGCADQLGVAHPHITLPAYWSGWALQPTWWRRNAAWAVPVALLFLGVLSLAVVWNRDSSPIELPELQLPPASSRTQNKSEPEETNEPGIPGDRNSDQRTSTDQGPRTDNN